MQRLVSLGKLHLSITTKVPLGRSVNGDGYRRRTAAAGQTK